MLFLNLIMLGGTLAAAVPATLHLWAKSKPRTVRWAAMHLLRGAEASQSRRMRIEQLILLLLRILIPVAMALLMARATLTGEQMLAGDKPVSLAVLLDDSASMQAAGRGQAANEAVAAVLQALPRGSDAVVLPLSGLGEDPASATDLAGLAKRVRAGAPGDAPAAVPLRLATTTPLVAGMARADRLVLLVSDLQTGSWSDAESDARRRLGKALADLPSGPRLALLPVPSGQPSNLVVGSISVDRELIGPGQPLRLRASLAAFGPQGFPSIRLRLLLDGSEVATASAELPAGGSTEALFPCTITKAGSHVLAVEASAPGDSIAADSTARLSVAVTEQVPVLLVDGTPDPAPLAGGTAYLELALAPPAGSPGLLRATTVLATRLDAALLAASKVAVLANVRSLRDEQVAALTAFVHAGGGLLVFPGDRCDAGWYARKLGEVLPASLGAVGSGRPAGILARRHDHPALALFDDPTRASLGGVEVRAWFQLTPAAGATTPLLLDNGAPLLAERRHGEGRVLLCATACTPAWSNLPLRPAFVPLVHELTAWLAATVTPPRNLAPGTPLLAALPAAGGTATLLTPDGQRHELPVKPRDGGGAVTWPDTRQPGVYAVTGQGTTISYVVQGSASEHDPAAFDHAGAVRVAGELGATLVSSAEELLTHERQRRSGVELWPWFWGLLLVLLFAEIAMIDRIAARPGAAGGRP